MIKQTSIGPGQCNFSGKRARASGGRGGGEGGNDTLHKDRQISIGNIVKINRNRTTICVCTSTFFNYTAVSNLL